METVWSLVIVVIAAVACGLIVWATDRRQSRYGLMLPVGAAVSVACVAWIALVAFGTGYVTGLTWMPWVVPMAAAAAAAVVAARILGRRREKDDVLRLTELLRH